MDEKSLPLNLYHEFHSVADALNTAGVPYCVVGGMAVSFLTTPRSTEDIDFLTLPETAEAAARAIESTGFFESAEPWTFSQSGVTLRRFMKTAGSDYLILDLMYRDSEDYRAIVANAEARDVPGGSVRLITREDLIMMKRSAGRRKDLLDIISLEESGGDVS